MHIPASSNRRAGSDCIASRLANLPRFDLAAEQLSADAVPDEVWCLSASRLSPVLLADEGNPQVRPQGDNLECPGWESNPHVLFRTGDFKSPASAIPPPGPCGTLHAGQDSTMESQTVTGIVAGGRRSGLAGSRWTGAAFNFPF